MSRQFTFCVSHKPPLVPDHLYDCGLGLGNYWPERGVHISDLDPYWHEMRGLAYGVAGNYAVRRAIQRNANFPELAGLFTYRKMLVRRDHSSFPQSAREVSPALCSRIQIRDIQPREDQQYLIAYPIELEKSLIFQYATWHHVLDLFEYISIAAELGVIDTGDVNRFAQQTTLIPGGCELGIYPATWLVLKLNQLSEVGREFLSRHGKRIKTYDRYQVRSLGFLSERLGSYLLLKELHNRYPDGIPPSIFGEAYSIVPDGSYYSVGVAED